MSEALIIGAVLLIGIGLVASQLMRLKDWLDRQPPPEAFEPPEPPAGPDEPGGPEPR